MIPSRRLDVVTVVLCYLNALERDDDETMAIIRPLMRRCYPKYAYLCSSTRYALSELDKLLCAIKKNSSDKIFYRYYKNAVMAFTGLYEEYKEERTIITDYICERIVSVCDDDHLLKIYRRCQRYRDRFAGTTPNMLTDGLVRTMIKNKRALTLEDSDDSSLWLQYKRMFISDELTMNSVIGGYQSNSTHTLKTVAEYLFIVITPSELYRRLSWSGYRHLSLKDEWIEQLIALALKWGRTAWIDEFKAFMVTN